MNEIDFDNCCDFGLCGSNDGPAPATLYMDCPECGEPLGQLCAKCAADPIKTSPDAWGGHLESCSHYDDVAEAVAQEEWQEEMDELEQEEEDYEMYLIEQED